VKSGILKPTETIQRTLKKNHTRFVAKKFSRSSGEKKGCCSGLKKKKMWEEISTTRFGS